ncbi:retrovirus-related Env polyprotein from transposon gypsy isoform X2 [Bactrocera dorsalis]|uniref:Retrovirus-related Env polyprotein from transposon gypsy isoform X2 n=1 Tax=Bactrocera dorsalis TaxID=27457 RepID=A0ABM3J9Y2_BACDO|nr:retrovirus-related Env polyprotein from transposon gypsy isoform X2 [Bactrocera dorsalis]
MMEEGIGKIQTGTYRIIHMTNITEYSTILRELNRNFIRNIPANNPLYPFITDEISSINITINNILPKYKNKRSLDYVGSAWKWIAGNPDHDDLVAINSKFKEVIENNNQQLIINKNILERINNITEISNSIIKSLGSSNEFQTALILKYKSKIDIIKDELENIKRAIHLTKANIINSVIINNQEAHRINKIFMEENLQFGSLEESLNFADVQIAVKQNLLIYMIKIPKTGKEICKSIIIKPLSKNETILKINFEKILKCNEEYYGIEKDCKIINEIKICKQTQIVNLENENCTKNLIRNKPYKCTVTNTEHVKNIVEINNGLILLNSFEGNITTNNNSRKLRGSYLIRIFNETIRINNMNFTTLEQHS